MEKEQLIEKFEGELSSFSESIKESVKTIGNRLEKLENEKFEESFEKITKILESHEAKITALKEAMDEEPEKEEVPEDDMSEETDGSADDSSVDKEAELQKMAEEMGYDLVKKTEESADEEEVEKEEPEMSEADEESEEDEEVPKPTAESIKASKIKATPGKSLKEALEDDAKFNELVKTYKL